jgi:Ca-activated chloride channel family protein
LRFSHPWWLAVGLAACLGLLLLWRLYDARQYAALARFVSAHLREELTRSVSIALRRLRRGLMLAALALLFAALAGPQLGYRWEDVSRRGNEIVFAVDTSRSMSTPDVKPDRLTRAKLAIDDFTNQLDGDAVGLVAFAGSAYLVCPITLDYGAFHESLSAIDINTIPLGGTNIAGAIREAQDALRRRPGSDKILILVTDGEDLEGDALTAAQAAARQDSLRIYTIGVGTAQGELIPVSADRGGGFVKDESGAFVKSRLDEPALQAIAAATGGLYAPLGAQGQGFETIYRASLSSLLKHDLASRQQRIYTERYQWPLAASLSLLLSSLLVGSRRRIRAQRPGPVPVTQAQPQPQPRRGAPSATTITPTLLLPALWLSLAVPLALAPAGPTRASTISAEEAYKQGDYAAAAKAYAEAAQHQPKKPVLQFNAGTAAYRAGQFPEAAKAFQESISRAPSGDAQRLADQEDAYYNLGNTLYRAGQKTEESSPQETLKTWDQAVTAYDTALQLRADDADSKYNRDFVKRKIEELKKKQNPPPQSNNGTPPPGQQPPQGQPPPGQSPTPPGQQPPQGQPPPGQQPPPAGQQPPQGQPPPGQQPPPPGQQPQQPPPAPQPPNQQPPPAQQPPSAQQPPPPGQQPPGAQQPPPNPSADQPDDTQRSPGQMSREEARQLLDSQKGEERRMPVRPAARRDAYSPPDTPLKDW